MDKEVNKGEEKQLEVKPEKIQKIVHFFQEIPLPEGSSVAPYKPLHTSNSKKSKKTKNKFDQFLYYRSGEDKNKIIKILFKNEQTLMIQGYYPFTDPVVEIENASYVSTKNLLKVIKTQAAYIGHKDDEIVIKKMSQVKLGEDGTEFDTIGDNFEIIKISNKQRFQQFLRILKSHPKALQISIRVIIDETDLKNPVIIDYQFFKRQAQIKNNNTSFIEAK